MEQEKYEKMQHTAAHIVAQAVLRIFPDAKLGIGPVTPNGFYYDILVDSLVNSQLSDSQLEKLENQIIKEAHKIIEREFPLTQEIYTKDEAIDILHSQGQIFKTELLQKVSDDKISFYKTGDEFMDLCRGPHVSDTGKVGAIKLKSIKKVNWLNDPSRPQLIRFSGLAFESEEELATYESRREELKKRDHRLKSWEQRLYLSSNHSQGTGAEVILDRGIKTKRRLVDYFSQKLSDRGFTEIEFSPYWKRKTLSSHELSGFIAEEHITEFSNTLTHIDLPLIQVSDLYRKLTEQNGLVNFGVYYVQEKINFDDYLEEVTGTDLVTGNTKPLSKQQKPTDGFFKSGKAEFLGFSTIFSSNQLKENIREVLNLLITHYKKLLVSDFLIETNIFINESEIEAEKNDSQEEKEFKQEILNTLIDTGININKIDSEDNFLIRLIYIDELDRNWTMAEMRYNSNLNSHLTSMIGSKEKLILLYGELITNIEKTIALISEKYDGFLPLEVSPYHAIVIPESPDLNEYAERLAQDLRSESLRIKLSDENISLSEKLNQAERLRYPYVLTVDEPSQNNKVMKVKPGNGEDLGLMTKEEFLQRLNR